LASALKNNGFDVDLVDCTFLTEEESLKRIKRSKPQIIGIYSMFSMKKTSIMMANKLRGHCDQLVVGGPLPTLNPEDFLGPFDVAVLGEGEETIVELANCKDRDLPISSIKGIAYREGCNFKFTPPRELIRNLDNLPFPARELFDNEDYKLYYLRKFGYSTTPLISSRGCPFSCDFCSRPVFGTTLRQRSPRNIVDEVEEIAALGFERVWFADDCFTLNPEHLAQVCSLLEQRHLNIGWECLSRVDTLNLDTAKAMKKAGCIRVFFGIESGNDKILELMNKRITTSQAKKAVHASKEAGLQIGAFFIIGYPGESDKTVLDTVRFASKLPLDYLSFTLPYPIPGTSLYDRIKDNGNVFVDDWEEPRNWRLIRHKLLYGSSFSETKLKFAMGKAQLQFRTRRLLGDRAYDLIGTPFEGITDAAFKLMP
jgi:anaerobic magnesium-protoporphyrin IX monomethyl ester cyclase